MMRSGNADKGLGVISVLPCILGRSGICAIRTQYKATKMVLLIQRTELFFSHHDAKEHNLHIDEVYCATVYALAEQFVGRDGLINSKG
jgi:hypothetical protein